VLLLAAAAHQEAYWLAAAWLAPTVPHKHRQPLAVPRWGRIPRKKGTQAEGSGSSACNSSSCSPSLGVITDRRCKLVPGFAA